jgi:hypothetical protein
VYCVPYCVPPAGDQGCCTTVRMYFGPRMCSAARASRHIGSWRTRKRARDGTGSARAVPLRSDPNATTREATRLAYDRHFPEMQRIYATGADGGSISVNMSMVTALRHFAASARADGVSEPPADSSHQGFKEGNTPRRLLEIGSALGSEALLFTIICRKPVDVVAVDVSAPCVAFAKQCAAPQAPPGARLSFVAGDVAEVRGWLSIPRPLGCPLTVCSLLAAHPAPYGSRLAAAVWP